MELKIEYLRMSLRSVIFYFEGIQAHRNNKDPL